MDRASRDFDVLATANGGTEVAELARELLEAGKRLPISALDDFDLDAAMDMARSIGFYHADEAQAAQILLRMWECFKHNDATLVEINPLAKVGDPDDEASKHLCALAAKISLDAVSFAGQDQGTGVQPANFLDIGGGASAQTQTSAGPFWTGMWLIPGTPGILPRPGMMF